MFRDKKIYITLIVVLFLTCVFSIYQTYNTSNKNKVLEKENKNLISEVKEKEKSLATEEFDPLKHTLPKNDYELIIHSKESAFQAYLYYRALMNYDLNKELYASINLSDYSVYKPDNRDDYIVFTDSRKKTEFVIFDDNQNYYHLIIKDIQAMQNGGSGTGARFYIYKDGYVVSAY